MKKRNGLFISVVLIGVFLLAACATAPKGATPPFDPQPIQGTAWVTKADHLVFILDASSSMACAYGDHRKFDIARSIVSNFNQTMPALKVQTTLRAFGMDGFVSLKETNLFYGPEAYSKQGLTTGLARISSPGGPSPMTEALRASGVDLQESKGPIAMVIISDGQDLGAGPTAAAAGLAKQFGDRLCIYTVLVGDDAGGRQLMEKLAKTTKCGRFATADSLASGAAMNAFVHEVLLDKPKDQDGDGVPDDRDKCPDTPKGAPVDKDGCPLDSDGDGVYDYLDKCPGTPRGVKVDASGCPLPAPPAPPAPPVATKSAEVTPIGTWLYKGVQFDTNKAVLKTESFPILDEIVAGLKSQPNLNVEIHGHTDSTGARAYNQTLSEKRAQTVRQYLIDKGIPAQRLTAIGYGPDQPIDTNQTTEGRARNRRVELKPLQ